MKRRCPKCRFIKKYILNGYQLTFRSKYGACDIEKKIGKKVYGALYIISKCAEKRLDVYEEYPTLYKKIYNSKNVSDITVEDVLLASKRLLNF